MPSPYLERPLRELCPVCRERPAKAETEVCEICELKAQADIIDFDEMTAHRMYAGIGGKRDG